MCTSVLSGTYFSHPGSVDKGCPTRPCALTTFDILQLDPRPHPYSQSLYIYKLPVLTMALANLKFATPPINLTISKSSTYFTIYPSGVMMWLSSNGPTYNNPSSQHRQRYYTQQNPRFSAFLPTAAASDSTLDTDSEIQSQSASSSPQSLSQFPLSTFDSVPTANVPRTPQGDLFRFSTPSSQAQPQPQSLPSVNMMYADSWLGDSNQFPAKNGHRNMHQRESSLSSLGSLGPASPFSFNTANPQIAINESGDSYHGLPIPDDQTYHLAAKAPNPTSHDTFYTNIPYSGDSTSVHSYATMLAPQRNRGDRSGLLPPPDFPSGGSTNSRPVSVASSVASDSPVTPAAPEPEDERRRKTALHTVPKLDRTMTDIYSDELYNPNFSITSMSPSQPSQTTISPNHEVFAQRLQAANSQHLSATHSPISTVSRGRSPFRQGSPLAPAPAHEFPQQSANNMRFNTAQHMREKRKAEQDAAQALRQAMAQPSTSTGTPQTISPKDAVLEFNDDSNNNFPLFSSQDSTGFDASQMSKAAPQSNNFGGLSLDTSFDNYLTSQLSSGMQLPQQYPFVAKHRQQSSLPSISNGSYSVSSRLGSSTSASPVSTALGSPQRPETVGADGGTYTCTYHGCTMRFESPTQLQKHKREGHRQAHGLNGLRRPEAVPASFLNTQAGPHKCERINPSTGKPCNTVFSRPYDLTRHEDTIHNARKQKVRCDVCTEEKTFSRADALTRHYRVCHPDLEFPGKHRKRGSATS
ncbi:hypothetical protein N8I77_006007 [Diaporthe amygdali]|uniref:C2H2-type domain-containing protein n=1 Tax=Phomopsis amygdali TaxID=1214568 RepID=A0AAD9W5A5_PHOAM|nr:hypothetical protein N8I77_006007 [Diaporthe amygdali]